MATTEAQLVEEAKRLASFTAVDLHIDESAKVIGVGSGSTVVHCVTRLLHHHQKSPFKACIPTSFQARDLILQHGLPLGDLNQFPVIDVAFDGADEVDSSLDCIKGGGACHLQEKLVAMCANKLIIVADYRKNSQVLGEQWKSGVPLEVVPFAYVPVMERIRNLGGKPTLRMGVKKAGPVVTDNGNFVVDADFGLIRSPRELNQQLISIPGIVETGLFCAMAKAAYFGNKDGTVSKNEQGL
ncbi:ribose 5-phosphate isomerase A-domain-containing protein [Polychytrium aggregatum]|uniref:ribose 5-phosphate isomerase A-domain-containing protein n=1 Tax=Polychytrium aggregatum TaxID=110093 RepID=UPI0022FEB93E|nr:ribose 5-phosphate isomerase A-domain-containing protein [Polychytrium aggregatum]KAI9205899.1 ribose 5-phosphate isomerase A-domain-containing protein [Polychytrium aggregatum]